MRLGLTIAAVLLVSGCGAFDDAGLEGDTDDFIDMDTPPGDCPAGEVCPSTTDGSGVPLGDPCLNTGMCVDDAFCVAPFDDGMVGEFVCTNDCIANDDEAYWCLDASACCDPNAVCNARGLCIPGAADDTGSGSDTGSGTGADGTDGTTGADTGGSEGTGGSGSTGGSEGSGSDTGTSTGAMEGG